MASFTLPAWAADAAHIFPQYSPFSWVAAGFVGVIIWVLCRLGFHYASTLRIKHKYNQSLLENGSVINPLDLKFERKRILLNDFVLPSHPIIEGKTFIDCDLIGPGNMYFHVTNQAQLIRPPKIDAVWLAPDIKFTNGFEFFNCIFRNCSFQRITIFASIENYDDWKNNSNLSWISLPPTPEDIRERKRIIEGKPKLVIAASEEPKAIQELEHKPSKPE